MNNFILCVVVMVAVAEGARVVTVNKQSDAHAHSMSEMPNLAFGADSGLSSLRPTTEQMVPSAKGVSRYRMTQTYGGLEVLGTVAEAEVTTDGDPTGQVYGHLAEGIEEDIPDVDACMQSVDEMIDIAVSNEGLSAEDSRISSKDCVRCIYLDAETKAASLIYRVEFFFTGENSVMLPEYYIDACRKTVLFSLNKVQNATLPRMEDMKYYAAKMKRQAEEEDRCETDPPATTQRPTTSQPGVCSQSVAGVGGNPKRGQIVYNAEGRCLNVEKDGNNCIMRNTYATVVDNGGSTSRDLNNPISFACDEGHSDPVNEAFGVANDAMYFGDITGRLYVEKYNVRALPYSPKLKVHYSSCYDNAFWDGTNMYFGDGCSTFYPLVSQDVVTHELGHGITSRNSNLEYRLQSGGMNEAFSDISGEVSKVFNFGNNDWRVGFNIFKSANYALRYFINPADDGRSVKLLSQYYDGLDVHYSSGIYNHAFYQLVDKQGMNIYDAYHCFLNANLAIWGSTTGMVEGACGVMQACYDLGLDHNKVKDAFSVVEIDIADCDFDALTTVVNIDTTRENIKVSTVYNPILKVSFGSEGALISTNSGSVSMTATSDAGAENVLKTGSGEMTVSSETGYVFVKLSSDSEEVIMVNLAISVPS